jgi:hypothetical protein
MIINPVTQLPFAERTHLNTLLGEVEKGSTYLNATLRIYDNSFKVDPQGNLVDGLELVSFCLPTPAFSIIENNVAVLNQISPSTTLQAGEPTMFTICDKDNIIRMIGTVGVPSSNAMLKIKPINGDESLLRVILKKGEMVKIDGFSIKVKILGG